MVANYDVVIVGGGIAGLSLASILAGECSVAVVEAEQELAYHSSSRSARQLIPSYGPQVVQELTVRTLELMAVRDDERGSERVLSPRGFMLIGSAADVAAKSSGAMEPISHAEAMVLCPALRAEAFEAAGLDSGSFACNAPLLIEDHRQLALAAGADILTGARVHTAQPIGSGWQVGAGQEALQAGVLVNAAGAWADELAVVSGVERLGLQPYRRTAAIADVVNAPAPAATMVAAADDSFYFRPEDGGVLISPAESEPSAAEDAQPRPGDIDRLVKRLNQDTTLGITGIRRAWTGLRTSPVDGIPVVGFDAEARGFFWLAGQGGYGFQTSSGIAEFAAGLILGNRAAGVPGPESRTAQLLNPSRLSVRG